MTGIEYYQFLLDRYMNDEASEAEIQELFDAVRSREDDDEEWVSIIDGVTSKAEKDPGYDPERWVPIINKILEKQPRTTGKYIKLRRFGRVVAAAAIIGFVVWGLWFVLRQAQDGPDSLQQAQTDKVQDIKPPETNRAMITLADGTKVYLDEAGSGEVAKQGAVKVIKHADGRISYEGTLIVNRENVKGELVYNTLTNPRGSRVIDIKLADGSRVWLNAGSSLKYPVAFIGKTREVSISGEAYFEVSHDANKPFKVSKGETEITVLGTQFNVNAYDDEADMKITLLEGSVNVKREKSIVKLVPGQSAFVNVRADAPIQVDSNADIDEVMGWKNGKFVFNSANIQHIMREISRWYDVDVVYEDQISNHFTGIISRDVNASAVLNMLEQTGVIDFKIEGKVVKVRKAK